jgi:pimeloyl-ACP methyl ester carboxylesterase
VTAYRIKGAVPTQDLKKIHVPVLVVHHAHDACKVCMPHEAKSIAGDLKNSTVKKSVLLDGGTGASGDPCESLHHHGFIGMEQETVDLIAEWIKKPTN